MAQRLGGPLTLCPCRPRGSCQGPPVTAPVPCDDVGTGAGSMLSTNTEFKAYCHTSIESFAATCSELGAMLLRTVRQTDTYYGDRIFGAIATSLRTSSWLPALIALGFATGFIHYVLDRSVYRMSDPKVRAAARGLLSRS